MKHPWERIQDIANMIGLALGALSIIFIGVELNNINIRILGVITFIFFFTLFIILFSLFIRDAIKIYGQVYKNWIISFLRRY